MQNDIQQRGVDFDLAVVVNQAQFSKLVHKITHAGARRTDHLRERLLADVGDDRLGPTVLTKIREKQEGPRQPLLAGVEQLVNQVRFNPDSARQEMRDEHLGKSWLLMEDADYRRFLQPHDLAFRHCCCGR